MSQKHIQKQYKKTSPAESLSIFGKNSDDITDGVDFIKQKFDAIRRQKR